MAAVLHSLVHCDAGKCVLLDSVSCCLHEQHARDLHRSADRVGRLGCIIIHRSSEPDRESQRCRRCGGTLLGRCFSAARLAINRFFVVEVHNLVHTRENVLQAGPIVGNGQNPASVVLGNVSCVATRGACGGREAGEAENLLYMCSSVRRMPFLSQRLQKVNEEFRTVHADLCCRIMLCAVVSAKAALEKEGADCSFPLPGSQKNLS